MKFILIFGPQAVGKMTIGHELEKITNLKLFHNHATIELVSPLFNYGTKVGRKLVNSFREKIFKEVVKSDLEGLIFTYVWYFESKKDWGYVKKIVKIFKDKKAEIYYIELEASEEERIKRNKTEHRLNHKPTKRNIEWSENELKESIKKHRLNSKIGEIKEKNYLRINNTNLSAQSAALKIKRRFKL